MYKYFLIFFISMFLFSCSKEKKNMQVTGNIANLKEGKLYLQKFKDTLIVNVDSIILKNSSKFLLEDNVASPEIYLLSLSGTDKVIQFFGDKGVIDIQTALKSFNYGSKITGSVNQDLLNKFNSNIKKFNDLRLDLIKEKFDASIAKNEDLAQEVANKINNIDKRKLRYAMNFAFSNTDFEVSPYITLAELYPLNTKFLDTILNSLSDKVKKSKYGIQLDVYIKGIKKEENK